MKRALHRLNAASTWSLCLLLGGWTAFCLSVASVADSTVVTVALLVPSVILSVELGARAQICVYRWTLTRLGLDPDQPGLLK